MNKKYQNGFFIFGLTVLTLMITQLDFTQVWHGLRHAGHWFLAVVALWAVLYVINTTSWYIIIKGVCSQGNEPHRRQSPTAKLPISFAWLYKVTVSGFALNYATPGGLMGGEPYRIMELTPRIGAERASSSVILYVMTHIFSHFWFWLLNVLLFALTKPLSSAAVTLLVATSAFCILGIWFFMSGYRKGLANRIMNLFTHIPFVRRKAQVFIESHHDQLSDIDRQVAALHSQAPGTFISAVLLELACRICSALEIFFILLVVMPHVNYLDCLFILAFTSLFANLLFFMPLQLGGREGGFFMSTTAIGISASAGIFVALIVRLRELLWTGIGLLLIKVERHNKQQLPQQAKHDNTITP